MIPTTELSVLHTDAATAVMIAVDGEVYSGREILLVGLQRAESLDGRQEEWAAELVSAYRKAIDGYSRRFGYRSVLLPSGGGLSDSVR